MVSFMKAYEAQTYALLRITTGFLFFFHGTQKLLGFPPMSFEAPWHIQYIAGGIELVGGWAPTLLRQQGEALSVYLMWTFDSRNRPGPG